MEEIHIKIGKKLNIIRKNKGLSLDKLAEITGVSKSMLGQIERGESIPTVTTLWKIANGLNLSFSSFVEEDDMISLVSTENIKPLVDEGGKYRVYPIFPFDSRKQFEIFIMELERDYQHHSEIHASGVEEYIVVSEGILEIGINEEIYEVKKGEAIRLPVDSPHYYRNSSNTTTRATLIIYYP